MYGTGAIQLAGAVVDIHLFFDSIFDIISFNSNDFNLIMENCTKYGIFIIFICITLFFVAMILRFLNIQRQFKFLIIFCGLSFYSKFLCVS